MKEKINKGFMLVETLLVTIFVSGVLLFLFIQFSNLSKSYDESFNYNTVEDLYALDDIVKYLDSDLNLKQYVDDNIDKMGYIDITSCSLFENIDYCKKLFELEKINKIFISKNEIDANNIIGYDESFKKYIGKLSKEGKEKYRVVASFNDNTYATLRFGG